MTARRELLAFAAVLSALVTGFFSESLVGGKVLSPADVLFVSASFRDCAGPNYEPVNRLLMDPVLQFQPWLEFNRTMLRQGRWPLWNDRAGCGAPHLANGQSAVFDPFHLIAYVGTLPEAYAWMAALRLLTAGLGMFLLARSWGLGPWGRWFSGLTYPFCGFVIVWLLFPVTNVAIWMPWLFVASDGTLKNPRPRTIVALAVVVGLVLVGGHVQTSAHVLLASGLYVVWRGVVSGTRRKLPGWALGISLGILLASVEIVPLGCYLTKSPVWGDRDRERPPISALAAPRLLDAACTALPYLYGSQRRGQPNLARGLGVHNLNESAGGFAGLATLLWLGPKAWSARRERLEVRFLAGLAGFGFLAAFGFPPAANLLRALPVLNVTDNRRLTLWLAFGLVMLGGIGLDSLGALKRNQPGRLTMLAWSVAALAFWLAAVSLPHFEPNLHARASRHYARAAAASAADPEVYRERAERQVGQVLAFTPRYLKLASLHLFALTTLAQLWRRGVIGPKVLRPALLILVVADLLAFGFGLNPAIAAAADRPETAVISGLRQILGSTGRAVALGEELPPNALMRYGLSDVRNYDSVETSRNLNWFAPLYQSGAAARTSRREIAWEGILRARERLRDASVGAIVAATPPPKGAFNRVDRVGKVWIARLDGAPRAAGETSRMGVRIWELSPGRIELELSRSEADRIIVRETFDAGWRAIVDGVPARVESYRETFLAVPVKAGARRLTLLYDPTEFRVACAVSFFTLAAVVFALTGFRPFRSTRIIAEGLDGPTPSR